MTAALPGDAEAIPKRIRSPYMNLLHLSLSSTLALDVGGIMQWSSWGLVVAALLGLSGCVRTDRGWVQEQLAVMQIQMAAVRDRVALVEQQFGRLDPKLDRIIAQTEQLASRQMDPAESPHDGRLVVDAIFSAGTTALTPAARQSIDAFIRQVPRVQDRQVVVVGHTDGTGSEEANYRLGQQRAAAVARYLFDEHGLDPVRVRVTTAGDTRPVADNATADGRQQNRRVEILVYRDQAQSPTEIRQRREPRQLTEDQREQLLRTLREDPKLPLAVVSMSGDNESHAFAAELDGLFDLAGWPTQGVSQQTVSGVPPGLTFVTKSGDATVAARAAHLQDTLHTMGIAAQSSALESMPQGLLMLVVGPQPP
jgi:outer membrane protein OmpA-like peptidoglycan-associated protein